MASTTRTRTTAKTAQMPPPAPPETAPQPVAEPGKRGPGKHHTYGAGPAAPKPRLAPMPVGAEFWSWLDDFTNDDWQNLIAYLWRTAPVTDRRFNGRPSSIRKYAVRFDLERIMLDEGSGGYRIDLVQIDPGTGKQQRIAQHFFNIMNMSYPPRVPLGDWTGDPENEMYKWAESALRAREAAADADAQGNEGAGPTPGYMDPNAMFNTVLNGMRTLRGEHSDNSALATQILQMVQDNQQAMMALNDPTKQIETLKTFLALAAPPANNGESILVTILRDELRATREEMKELRNKPQAPGILEELLAKAPQLQELGKFLGFNRRPAGEGTNWGEVAIQAIDKLAGAIPYAIDTFRNRQNTPPGQAGFELQPRPQYQPPPQQAPPPQSTDAQPEAHAMPAAGTGEEEETRRRLQGHLNKYQQLITAVAPFLIDQYKSGLTGYDFRDWFINRHGILNWTGLKDEVGATDLTALAQLHPHLKVALAPPEKLLAFLTEVFTDPGQEASAEDEDEQPAVVTMPAGRA